MFDIITEDMHQHSRRTKTYVIKIVIIAAILLISLQYLVNVAVFRRKDSIIFVKLLESSVENMLNQTEHALKARMRDAVTKMEKPLELCPVIPPKLKGHVKVNAQVAAWAYIEQENAVLAPGGRCKPADCLARHRVAIVIPYRDREIHLKIFLKNIHPFLQRQQLDYGIFVVETAKDIKFNRALLMNVGFVEAMKQYDYQCFVFHDVDLLPEDDRNLYSCPQFPRHMSVAIDRLHYKLPYAQIFGGVSAMTTEHFKKINGFSNIFFGWGGEDDDMYKRILYSNLTVIRYSPEVARYKMLIHAKESGNSDRFMLLKSTRARRKTDGITSLKYKIEKIELKPLYTWILVSVNETEIVNAEPIHKLLYRNLKRIQKHKKVRVDKKVSQNELKKLANQGKVVQPGLIKQINEIKVVPPNDKKPVNQVQTGAEMQMNQGKIAQTVGKKEVNQNVVEAENKNSGEQVIANVKQVEAKVDKNNQVKTNDSVHDTKVKSVVEVKQANVSKQKPNAPKQKLIYGAAKRSRVAVVSWIPSEFKGIIPANLTKFEPLPVFVPAHVLKKKVKKHAAHRKSHKRRAIVNKSKVNVAKSIKTVNGINDKKDKTVPQQANTGVLVGSNNSLNDNGNTNENVQKLGIDVSKHVPENLGEQIQGIKPVR